MDESAKWVRVAAADQLGKGEMLAAEAGGQKIALYHLEDDSWCATSNICTHAYALLTEGWLDDDCIECPLHAGRFNVRTGQALSPPVDEDLPTFPVKVEGGDVLVGVKA